MNAITRERHEQLKGQIEPLLQQVEHWRNTKGKNEKIPEPLWQEAICLAKVYGVSPVQRILRIDYRGLEHQALEIVKPAAKAGPVVSPSFIELPFLPARRAEHLVESENGAGRKLSLKIAAGHLAEVLPVVQSFSRCGV